MTLPTMTRLSGLLLILATHVQAQQILEIEGALHESPCVLDMTSVHQTVDLGNVSRSQLLRPGDQASAVAFQLRLQDCMRTASHLRDTRTGNRSWSAYQPVVSVAFLAPADPDDPRLVKVQGVTGVGLRMTDSQGRDVRLGSWGAPLFVSPGGDALTWHVQPTRTTAPLSSGAFQAIVDFRLNYE